jgi:hypothetical protein
MVKPRKTHPKYRPTRRAATENWDIIKLAAFYWDVVTHAEEMLAGIVIHNAQQKVNLAMISKCKEQAKALGHHLIPPNPVAFKTAEMTNIIYERALGVEMAKASKNAQKTARTTADITFY